MKTISITQGKETIVDDEDFETLSEYKWSGGVGQYSKYVARVVSINGKRKTLYMHRFIMKAPENMQVDHINRNTYDNRKENLRICTRSQNRQNTIKPQNNTSGFKGVSWFKDRKKYGAYLTLNGKMYHYGFFSNKIEAAKMYNKMAKKVYGEFALLNKIP